MNIPLAIAEKMARALRSHQCPKVEFGQWPAFKPDAKFKERTCYQCDALAAFDAFTQIVQVPKPPAPEAKP